MTVAAPRPVSADETYGYFQGVEMVWNGLHEEAAQASTPTPPFTTTTALIYFRVTTLKRFKLVIYSQAQNYILAETVMTPATAGTHIWKPTIGISNVAQSLGVYAYYWNGSAYIQDDVAYGWLPIHYQLNVGYYGRWGPNGYSLPDNYRSGDFAMVTQYFWWWDNNVFSGHTVGTDNQARLDAWAADESETPWLLHIEFRRVNRPYNAGDPKPVPREGWNFEKVSCGLFGCSSDAWEAWDSDLKPYIRPGDTEEIQTGGDEEAQFEMDNEDLGALLVVHAREPEVKYGNMHHLRVWFRRLPGYAGDPVYMVTEMELLTAFPPSFEDYDFLQHLRTSF